MNFKSKNTSLILLGITAVLCSRALFLFFNDPEGPNLLIVVVLATVIYLLSFAAYTFMPSKIEGMARLSIAVGVQIFTVIGLYLFMK